MTSRSLWNYYRDEVNDGANENNTAGNHRENNRKITTSKFFEYNTKIIGSTPVNYKRLDTELFIALKYLSNFWRSLNLSLIICKIELNLRWSRKCVIPEIYRTPEVAANPGANPPTANTVPNLTFDAEFQINNTKLYVPVVTLSIKDTVDFSENMKQELKRTISWNKYRSEITTAQKQQFRLYD